MVDGADLPPPAAAEAGRVRRRQRWVMLGLLLTLVGLLLLVLVIPSSSSALSGLLPFIAAGLLALWVGGLLLGMGMGMKSRRGGGSAGP